MTKLLTLGSRILLAASVCACATSPCRGDDLTAATFGERSDRSLKVSLDGCDDYPIALYPDANAQAKAEAELQNLEPGAQMIWHPVRGTFWFVTLTVPLPQCGPQGDVFTQLFALTRAHPDLFQLNLKEWKRPAPFPCAQVGELAQVLEIKRARIGSHPISQDLMRFTVQRVNGIVELQALFGEYLPPATPWLDMTLSACPNLDEETAEQVVLDSQFVYSIFFNCYYMGSGSYSPNRLDTIDFEPGAKWAWYEDPTYPRVLFTKSTQGSLLLDSANYTPDLLQSDANCPDENGQPSIGFRLTMDSVTNDVAGYQPGLDCVVCLGEIPCGTTADELPTDALDTAESKARSCACGPPNGGLWATFQVGSETFKQKITNPTAIADAIAVWQGQSNKHIPVGSLRCSCSGWNCGWSFTMDPATLVMASSAIEICDGLPSYVNQTCPSFGGGSYCPWSAVMVDLRDCRTNPACPVMSR